MLIENFEKLLEKFMTVPVVQNDHLPLARFIKKFFRFYQFWFEDNYTLQRVILGWIIYWITNTVLFASVAHVVRYSMETDHFDYHEVSSDFPIIVAIPAGYVLFKTFYTQQKSFQKLIYEMGNFEEYEKPHGIELHDAKSEAMLKLSMLIIAAPIPFLIISSMMDHCPDPGDYSCGLMFPGYFPGCMGRYRKICAVLQLCSGYSLSYIGYLCSAFYCQLSEYIVIYLKHLQNMIGEIPAIQEWHPRRIHVLKSLRYHQRVLELYDLYHLLVKEAFLIHIFATPIILAMCVFTFLTDFHVQNVSYSLLWIISLLFVCLIGQRMVDESEKIAEVAYDAIPWDGDNKTATDLMLLMLRSQRPLNTPAGSLTYCGNALFVAVMKTTYSYLALLQSTGATDM